MALLHATGQQIVRCSRLPSSLSTWTHILAQERFACGLGRLCFARRCVDARETTGSTEYDGPYDWLRAVTACDAAAPPLSGWRGCSAYIHDTCLGLIRAFSAIGLWTIMFLTPPTPPDPLGRFSRPDCRIEIHGRPGCSPPPPLGGCPVQARHGRHVDTQMPTQIAGARRRPSVFPPARAACHRKRSVSVVPLRKARLS